MAEVSSEEFERWMSLHQQAIQGVHDRLDKLNGRTRANEVAIAGMQARGAVIATVIATAIAGVIEGIHVWFSK